MLRRGQPPPQRHGGLGERALVAAHRVEQRELVGARPLQQRADQAVLGAEEVEQHPRAGADGLGERPQRHPDQAVLAGVPVGAFEQLRASRRFGHVDSLPLKQSFHLRWVR